ncbi:hypothetical protein LguiA_005926 [Lonicera macranthoides]
MKKFSLLGGGVWNAKALMSHEEAIGNIFDVNQLKVKQNRGFGLFGGSQHIQHVIEAYSAHFARDMGSFLSARAEEIVCGGLMAIVIPCLPLVSPHSKSTLIAVIDLFEKASWTWPMVRKENSFPKVKMVMRGKGKAKEKFLKFTSH